MSPEQLHEWGERLTQARAEWSGAFALSCGLPKGSSAAYRADEELEELGARISEDFAAWSLRYNAALDEVAALVGEIQQHASKMQDSKSALKAAAEAGDQAKTERLKAEGRALVAWGYEQKARWAEGRQRLDALRGYRTTQRTHDEAATA